MKKTLSLGVVGCGYWGPNLVRNFNSMPNCHLRMMCDLDQARLQHLRNLYPAVEGTTDFKHMLNGAGLDAVVIATPVRYHHPLAKESLLAGKHTFIEKPMASSSAECEELIEIAEKKGLTLMIGHTFLYSAPVRKILEVIKAGDIGEIRSINSRRLNLGLFQKDINVAWDLAPHDISIVLHILGESPLVVNCQGNAHVTPGIEDVTNLSLTFSGNRFVSIQSSWLEPRKVREMTIVGTRRMIVYDVRVDRPPHYDSFAEFQYSYHYGDSYIPHLKQEEPLKELCQHFVDCIRSGATPLSCGRRGLELVKILEAASLSLKAQGAPIQFASTPASAPPEKPKTRRNGT